MKKPLPLFLMKNYFDILNTLLIGKIIILSSKIFYSSLNKNCYWFYFTLDKKYLNNVIAENRLHPKLLICLNLSITRCLIVVIIFIGRRSSS